MADLLNFRLRTPEALVFDGMVRSVRVPVETGLVGIRPRSESLILAVEPGLIILRHDGDTRFAATVGGLFEHAGWTATLFTPFGVVGEEREVLEALDRVQASPEGDLAARRRLADLEGRIVREIGAAPQGRTLGPEAYPARDAARPGNGISGRPR